jgi:hypothetical protein
MGVVVRSLLNFFRTHSIHITMTNSANSAFDCLLGPLSHHKVFWFRTRERFRYELTSKSKQNPRFPSSEVSFFLNEEHYVKFRPERLS